MSNKRTFGKMCVGRLFVGFVAVGCAVSQRSLAQRDDSPSVSEQDECALSLSPPVWPEKRVVNAVLFQGVTYRQRTPRALNFDGQMYTADVAIPLLMRAFFDQTRPTEDRERALRTLSPIDSQLAGTPYIAKLIEYSENCDNRDLKLAILGTVARSLDARGLALFSTILRQEQDPVFRLAAAGPLAAWNVRSGVHALLGLLDSELMVSESQPLWWVVLKGLEDLNNLKDWGFPMATVKAEVDQINDREERLVIYRQRWKTWFANNEPRFADWKPGDTLPEITKAKARG